MTTAQRGRWPGNASLAFGVISWVMMGFMCMSHCATVGEPSGPPADTSAAFQIGHVVGELTVLLAPGAAALPGIVLGAIGLFFRAAKVVRSGGWRSAWRTSGGTW